MSNDNKNQQSSPQPSHSTGVAGSGGKKSGGDSRPPPTSVPNGGVPFQRDNGSPWKKGGA
jgi:hypothetical protein